MPAFDPAIEDQLNGPTARSTGLVDFNFRSGMMRLWSGYGDLMVGGNLYQGIGKLGQLSEVSSGPSGAVDEMTFSLFGDETMLVHLEDDAEESEGQEVELFAQFFDVRQTDGAGRWVDWQPLADPIQLFWGRMGPLTVRRTTPTEDNPATRIVSVSAQSILVNRARPVAAYFSDRDQRSRTDGTDAIFSRVSQYSDATVKWPTF